jgi:hypothetical protein
VIYVRQSWFFGNRVANGMAEKPRIADRSSNFLDLIQMAAIVACRRPPEAIHGCRVIHP